MSQDASAYAGSQELAWITGSAFRRRCSNAVTLVKLKATLLEIMDQEKGNIRFYHLGSNRHGQVEHYGVNSRYDPDGFLRMQVRGGRSQDS